MLMPRVIALRPAQVQIDACRGCSVREAALFGALSEAGLSLLHTDRMPIEALDAPADHLIYRLGDAGSAAFTVREGLVRLERISEGGRRCIVRVAGRGELIGAEAILGERYTQDAVACTPVSLCRIPIALLERMQREEPALQLALMRRWQRALDAALTWRIDLQTGPAHHRVLRLLDLLGRHAGPDQTIWLPRREEIADLLGMALETASRSISRLRRDGVLDLLPGGRSARLDGVRLGSALAAAGVA